MERSAQNVKYLAQHMLCLCFVFFFHFLIFFFFFPSPRYCLDRETGQYRHLVLMQQLVVLLIFQTKISFGYWVLVYF